VDDVLEAMLQVASRPESRGEIYNCASGARITIRELAEHVTHLDAGSHSPIETGKAMLGEVRGFAPDNSKIRKLGAEFTPFETGLRKTFEWYREHRVRA
jgi:UDP-glucose 4-epimerase